MTEDRILELAEEAANCIGVNGLTAAELEDYLQGFLTEVVDEVVTGEAQTRPCKKRRKRGRRT